MELRYLEGTAALKGRIKALTGRTPNALQVAFASSCLLHGRLFWNSAKSAPLETKPLLLYYGAAAFAKALILARGTKPGDISQKHGLSCAEGDGRRVANFTVKANGTGVFQQFNDVVAPLNSFRYFEDTMSRTRAYPTAFSAVLSTLKVTLDDCLARVPELAPVYQLSTEKAGKTLPLHVMDEFDGHATHSIRVDVPQLYDGESSLRDIVSEVRSRAPFLERWRLKEASKNWDNTVLVFDNYQRLDNEHYILASTAGAYTTQQRNYQTFDALDSLPPLTGGSSGITSYAQPIEGQYVSEHSIVMVALFGLSALVRYHPHTWTACVYRRQLSNYPIDDTLLPVVEEFLAVVEGKFPRLIAELML